MRASEEGRTLDHLLETSTELDEAIAQAVARDEAARVPDAGEQGSLVELLRTKPERREAITRLPARLLCMAAIVACEAESERNTELREIVENALTSDTGRTTAEHVRRLAAAVVECYRHRPAGSDRTQ